ncbi:Gfo/Idh/MocA family protein [Streptomyces chattanoogensis]|uniref:Gfo/Idh/MocA family protein n=1 Tax=Streptomyces chattanoogensis TaxID=66876 RepID=UPI0036951DCC
MSPRDGGAGLMDPVRIAVMGLASIARRRLLPAMAACPDVEIVAVASRDADRAREAARAYGCRAVHGYDGLLDRADVEAVYVPLPSSLHARWTEAALRAGKHVLVEKPLADDAGRAAALLASARSAGLVLRENVMFVHHGQHAAVRGLVEDGAIGQLRSFQAVFTIPPLPDDDIRYDPDLGGGALADVGVYPVRAAQHFLGPDLAVRGAVLTAGPGRRVETSGAALLTADGGVTAQLSFGMEHAYRSAYELCGSEGRIRIDRAFTPPADHEPVVRLTRASGTERIRLPAEDQVASAVAAFAAAVRAGAPADDAPLWQARLLDGIRRRAAEEDTDRAESASRSVR